jgi:hypothetical protein
MLAQHANPRRKISTSLIIGAGVAGAVALALAFGGASLDIAKFGAPHNVALQAAQLGFGAPAQAAPLAPEVGYLPAHLAVQADQAAEHPQPF